MIVKLKPLLATAFFAGAALFAGAANANWNTNVERTDGGHMIGNPEAKLKITEFISYTCPHCATFARQGEAPLQFAYIGPGKATLEVRHLVLNPVDLTAAMLTWCGSADKFPANHAAFMYRQKEWLGEAEKTSPAQRARWQLQDLRTRNRAIASDLKFYKIMEGRGYSLSETEDCLADTAVAEQLMRNTQHNAQVHGVQGTPSFLINGVLQDHTHDWAALEPLLIEAFKAETAE